MAFKFFTALPALAFAVALPGGAWANEAKFSFVNKTNETIYIKAFSKAREGWTWPGKRHHWILKPAQTGSVSAGDCQSNEKICYGGANPAGSRSWGDSLTGKSGCANCCIQCGEQHHWNLVEGADPVKQSGVIDNGPALVPVEE